jgi:glycosyltransferase involved in cell wall biosynthesis
MIARVAVLIPCHNDGPTLLEAIESIDEPEPVEIVVVDDASTDSETLECLTRARDAGILVVRNDRNVGAPAARTQALRATSAPYVFPLDADDQLVPGTLTRMADLLDADREAVACYGDYAEFGSPPDSVRKIPERLDPFRIAYANEFGAPLLRRTAVEELGGWVPDGVEPRTFGYEDWHVWMGLAERGGRGIHVGPGVVTYRRRVQPGRRMSADRKQHGRVYDELRRLHPDLFEKVRTNRRNSDLSRMRKLLYPIVYGRRRRRWFERRVRVWLDRRGVWTQR